MDANKEDKKQTVKPTFLECLFSKDKWCDYLKNNKLCKEKSKKRRESGIKQAHSSQSENSSPFFTGQQKNTFKKRYGSMQDRSNKLHNPRIGCSFYCSLESKDKKKRKEKKTQEWKVVDEEVSEEFVVVDDSETVSENSMPEKNSKPNCSHSEEVVMIQFSETRISPFKSEIPKENDTKSIKSIRTQESKEMNNTQLPDWLLHQSSNVPRSESLKNEIIPYLNRKKLSTISNKRKVSFLSDVNENYVRLKPNNTIVNYVHVDDTNKKMLDSKSEIFNIINKLTSLETKLDDIEDKNKTCEDKIGNEDEVIEEQTEGNNDGMIFKDNLSERAKIFEKCCQISSKISKDCEEYYKIYYSQNKNSM